MQRSYTYILTIILFISSGHIGLAQELIRTKSKHSAEKTIRHLKVAIEDKGMSIMQEIRHQDAAEKVGLELDYNTVLVFGNPSVGTKLMQTDPQIGIMLPLKIHVFAAEKDVWVSYISPLSYTQYYNLQNAEGILNKMEATLKEIVSVVEVKK